ncbi:FecR family protein [Patescibacteria group bacterium]|nr:FecR family protein [Patescibacteria group bacterium]
MPRIPRKRPIDYILPFLIMICTGVIVVLGYQLYSSLQGPEEKEDIYMYLANGSAKILPWGSGEWERAYSGTRLFQGDSIKTPQGGRIVVELFEDHYIRMDERTELSISEIKASGDGYEVEINLQDGKIWINSDETSDSPVRFNVRTKHTSIQTVATVYEVEQNIDSEVIRVMEGEVLADIFVDEGEDQRKVESISIGVGQESVITDQDLQDYADMKNPSVINAIADEFKESFFYKWNYAEDKLPTDYSLKGGGDFNEALIEGGATEDPEQVVTEEAGESDLPCPIITTPSTNVFTTPESSLTLRGTTSEMTKQMMVDVTSGSNTQTYELNLYVTGGSQWSFAISAAGGNMKAGTNIYKFYAIDENDLKSATATVTVVYESDGSVVLDEDAVDPEEEVIDEETEEVGDLGDFVAPKVLTYNGGESNEFDVDGVSVSGSVAGAEKVLVNGYQLTAFKPGDTKWTFYAKESLGNLSDGENTYNVVAYAPDGSTKSVEAIIIYDQPEPEEEEVPAEEPVADESEPAVDETPADDTTAATAPKPLLDTTVPSTPAPGEPDASDPAA